MLEEASCTHDVRWWENNDRTQWTFQTPRAQLRHRNLHICDEQENKLDNELSFANVTPISCKILQWCNNLIQNRDIFDPPFKIIHIQYFTTSLTSQSDTYSFVYFYRCLCTQMNCIIFFFFFHTENFLKIFSNVSITKCEYLWSYIYNFMLKNSFFCSFISKNSNFFKKEYKAHKKIQSSVLFISFISILFPYTCPIVYPPLF